MAKQVREVKYPAFDEAAWHRYYVDFAAKFPQEAAHKARRDRRFQRFLRAAVGAIAGGSA